MELWDENLSEFQLKKCFARFHATSFGVIPESEWPTFLRQLLPYENSLAYSQNCLGKVAKHPFDLVLTDLSPVTCKPFIFHPEKQEWVKSCVQALIKATAVTPWKGHSRYTSNVVLAEN